MDLQLEFREQEGVATRATITSPVVGHVVFEVASGKAFAIPKLRKHHDSLERQILPFVSLRNVVVLGRGADVVPEDILCRLSCRWHGVASDDRQPCWHSDDLRRLQRLLDRVVGDRTVEWIDVATSRLVKQAGHPIDRPVACWSRR